MEARASKRRRISPAGDNDQHITSRSPRLSSNTTIHIDDSQHEESSEDLEHGNDATKPAEISASDQEADDSQTSDSYGNGSSSEKAEEVADGVSIPAEVHQNRSSHTSVRKPYMPEAGRQLSQSNMFSLQTEEMLRQITLRHGKREAAVDEMLYKLKAVIEALPGCEPMSIEAGESHIKEKSGIIVPFPTPKPARDAKYKLVYTKPASINVIGSYAHKTVLRIDGNLSIDMVVNMPASIFTEKDYLNYRYFHKRAYYLAYIAAGIENGSDFPVKLRFQKLHGNNLQPIILVEPIENASSDVATAKCTIRIIPALAEDIFPIAKTLPSCSCIRVRASNVEDKQDSPATPFYNASLRVDCCMTSYLKLLHGASVKCAAFRDACILGRVWLRQRGLGSPVQKGGFGNFEWAATMALLLDCGGYNDKPVLSPTYHCNQLFKATLQYLALRNLVKQPLIVKAQRVSVVADSEEPTLFDGARSLNLLFKMSTWSYNFLQQEAVATLRTLSSNAYDSFDSTFILRVDKPLQRYDTLVRVRAKEPDHVYRVIRQGLGSRVSFINVILPENKLWPVNQAEGTDVTQEYMDIALVLDPKQALRTVDRGPPLDDKEAATAFRKFWGEKAELRRFKDGQILESVVWTQPDASTKSVLEQIITDLLSSKFGINHYTFNTGFDSILQTLHLTPGTNQFGSLMSTYSTLERVIGGLQGLPLQIRQIQASDAQLRYASIAEPGDATLAPSNMVIQFEGSGRWPDDLSAVQMTKMAFLLKLGELLQASLADVITRVGLMKENQQTLNGSFLDVIYPSGVSFRIQIHHEREQTLIERQLSNKVSSPRARENYAVALAEYKRTFIYSPIFTQRVQKLCTEFTALSPSLRLLKKWFASHMLSRHFTSELIETFAIRAFIQPHPWPQAPSSATTGLLRTLLFLSRWDWRRDPLIIDTSASMKTEDTAAVVTRFDAWRKIDPHLNRVVLFVATDFDREGVTWTDYTRPSKVVAARMTALARAACKLVHEEGPRLDVAKLFRSPLVDYDFVIHLNSKFTSKGLVKDGQLSRFKNLQQSKPSPDTVGYAPVQFFLSELESLYGDAITFFYDGTGGDVIGGLWSPHTISGSKLEPQRRWKVNLPYSTKLVHAAGSDGKEDGAEINKDAVMSEVARLGGDMVLSVKLKQ